MERENNTKIKTQESAETIYFMSQKFQPVVTQMRKSKEVLSKRGRVPLYQYFHPQAFKSSHTLGSWLGFLCQSFGFFVGKNVGFLVGWWWIFIPSFRGCLWPVFRWEEGLGPFRCYFYDLVYYVLCLGKGLVAFLHDYGNKVASSLKLLPLVSVDLGRLHLGGWVG